MADLVQRYRRWLLAAVAALAGVGVTVVVVDNGPDHGPGKPRTTVTITVGTPKRAAVGSDVHGTIPTQIAVPKTAVAAAAAGDLHRGARSEEPAGVTAAELDAKRAAEERLAATDQLPLVTPDAAPSQRGCVTRLVQNYSSRRGVRPRWLVAHYTVSRNVPGWADVNAIVGLFDRPAYQASSDYVIDGEGNCAYIVRESDKAWTQAAANPFSISIEFVAMGDEGKLTDAQLAKGGLVFADAAKRWGIPIQLGREANCTPVSPGVVDHAMLGACGGGHHDIKPMYGQSDAARLAPLLAAIRKAAGSVAAPARAGVTGTDRATCRKLTWWRAHGRPHGKPEANAVRRRRALNARQVACTAKGPVLA